VRYSYGGTVYEVFRIHVNQQLFLREIREPLIEMRKLCGVNRCSRVPHKFGENRFSDVGSMILRTKWKAEGMACKI